MKLAILLLPGWREDKKTMMEFDRAYLMGIPVFGHIRALSAWVKDPKCLADGKKPSHKKPKRLIPGCYCGEDHNADEPCP